MVSGRDVGTYSERYQRLRGLGRGSFGEVFEAEDSLLGRRVAVKVLPFADSIPVLARRALLTEARMAAAAGRSAVQVFDLVDEPDGAWLVMEYIERGSLKDWASPDRTPEELRTITASLLDRMAVMHDLGLIHGDVHPGNILVRADDDVALADFGLARMAAETNRKRGAHEIHWSAPEVLGKGKVSPAADVYSLALVVDWLYREAGQHAPSAVRSGLRKRPADRPADGRAFAGLFEHGTTDVPAGEDTAIEEELAEAADAMRSGRTQQALGILEGAIRHAPLDVRPRRRLALARWSRGERQAAMWMLESAQKLDPADKLTSTMLLNWRDAMEDA